MEGGLGRSEGVTWKRSQSLTAATEPGPPTLLFFVCSAALAEAAARTTRIGSGIVVVDQHIDESIYRRRKKN